MTSEPPSLAKPLRQQRIRQPDGVTTFNVIGFTQQSVTIFLSTGGDTVYVYVGEETIPVSLEE